MHPGAAGTHAMYFVVVAARGGKNLTREKDLELSLDLFLLRGLALAAAAPLDTSTFDSATVLPTRTLLLPMLGGCLQDLLVGRGGSGVSFAPTMDDDIVPFRDRFCDILDEAGPR